MKWLIVPGFVTLALLTPGASRESRAQDLAGPALQVAYRDDDREDYFEDLREAREEYLEDLRDARGPRDLREAREDYFEDLRDAQRRVDRRARKRGYTVIPYAPYAPGPAVLVPPPAVYSYPAPYPAYGVPYYRHGGGVSIPFGPYRGIDIRW